MNTPTKTAEDRQYQEAIASVENTLARLRGCPAEELAELQGDVTQLNDMYRKVTTGRVEIVLFGEISTGKSALINALVGRAVAEVDVQGGWTKQVWGTSWDGCGYRVPGLDRSEVVLVDTPGINEIGGKDRAELADTTARRADMILFVTDSDLNETEFSALVELAAVQKPIILVFNKTDLYTREQRDELTEVLTRHVDGIIPPEHIVHTMADPRPIEYVIHQPDGATTAEWKKPEPQVDQLKSLILETLEREGLDLIALNAAMYAADKSDKISTLRVQMRNRRADQVIWTLASTKAVAVAANPVPAVDILTGLAIDAVMISTLSKVYGLNFSMAQARGLAKAISKGAGLIALGELTSWGASFFKLVTGTLGTALTLLPQGAAAGFSSYIIGQASKHYFEHGGSWGAESAKTVVQRILDETDKDSILSHLKDEIRRRLAFNRHARQPA
ncbi:MAG: YcjF family protein [Pirellulaceae bacterium]